MVDSLDVDKPDLGVETQRLVRAQATVALAKAVKKGTFGSAASKEDMRKVINEARAAERSVDVKRVMDEALTEL